MRAVLVPLLLVAAACEVDLPEPYRVQDLRVLAVVADPPELVFDGPQASAMTFRALVVDPRGGELNYTWRFCPVESDVACNDYGSQREAADPSLRASLDELAGQSITGVAAPANDDLGVGAYAVPELSVVTSAELVRYHQEASLLGYGMGGWPAAVLEVQVSDRTLVTQKRVVLSPRDLASYAPTLELGFRTCSAEVTVDCVPFGARFANTNPAFERIEVAYGARADAAFVPLPSPLVVSAGEDIRIRPILTPAAYESFQVLRADVNTRAVFVETLVEAPSVHWFVSDGDVAEAVTAASQTKSLDTVFTAPERAPASGTVTLWLVARDGRGGVAWHTLVLTITD